jgi:two-component system, cell cycle sensor histidine kinase and response regulator CckA
MSTEALGTVLIVEDEEGTAELQRRRLERAGFAVRTAATAEAALAALAAGGIDLAMLDFQLPGGVTGLDVFARMKEAGFDVPVILVTGFSAETTVIQALRAGVRDFVAKSSEYLDYLPEAVRRVARGVQTERRLAESEARLASVIATAKDAIIVTGPDQRITLFNPAAEQMFGCPAAAARGRPLALFIPPEAHEPTGAARDGGGAAAPVDPTPTQRLREGTRGVRADGTEFPLEASVSRAEIGGRRSYTVVVRDVTERRRLEEQYRQAQKMEAVGRLAGGVAHDFNNLLTIISGYSELVIANLPAHDPNRALVQGVYDAGERAALLTRQLLTFSRKQLVEPRVLDLNAVVADAGKMLRRLIGEDITLATDLAPGLDRVRADPGQVEQVIMNLAVNARDAMPQGGRLSVETRAVELDPSSARTRPGARPGRYVRLSVGDTGCGMTEEVRRRAFEPFFTTKGPGQGTGLGLATVFGIVQHSGGHVEVETEVGRGTTFKVYLPSAGLEAVAERAAAKPLRSGTETVLVVEDDDAVRAVTRLTLQVLGYTVLEARGGEDALRACDAHPAAIDLLITDVVMPGMSGRQVAEAVAQRRPGVKVLFCSGYTDDAVVRHGVLQAEAAFLQKPFTVSALGDKIRAVLEANA